MNKKLIFQLSLFGLAMAFASVFFIPSKTEPIFWLAIFIICAYVIAIKCRSKYFMHGFMVSIVNSIWVTSVHILFFQKYVSNHLEVVELMGKMPMPYSPRIMMLLSGLPVGIASGLVLGLFCFVTSRIVKRKIA